MVHLLLDFPKDRSFSLGSLIPLSPLTAIIAQRFRNRVRGLRKTEICPPGEVVWKRAALIPGVPRPPNPGTLVNWSCLDWFHFLQQNVRESWYQIWYQTPENWHWGSQRQADNHRGALGLRENSKVEMWSQELARITENKGRFQKWGFSCWKDPLEGGSA